MFVCGDTLLKKNGERGLRKIVCVRLGVFEWKGRRGSAGEG